MSITLDSPAQRRWCRRSLVIGFLVLLLPTIGSYLYGVLRTLGAALISHNYTDRPIGSFWVNDFWGGNLAVMGGGGVMCCQNIDASKAKVVWILSMSQAQENQGMKIERHEIEVQMPERKTGDDTLHVFFHTARFN
ncbi:DUF3304 domain-containing protein [Pseudomonas sp. UYIF39]|uniref:DUF3304 domain-containing protein n=1 Tax=Pseudomonas sp. UYIF39 TaxID=1630747 RepID=UPI00249ED97C|nr:DUF3304 domain-containing protein [Pseudomonas sp. UYIF39]MDI3353167.1 DUF3304 domain-containing protein [Pseudomonas sp. UYIF39]